MEDPASRLLPEEQLLVSLCRLDFPEDQLGEIKQIIKEIRDWDYFTRMANSHGIIALIANNIQENNLEQHIPGPVLENLKNGRLQSLLRNAWLTEQWKKVDEILINEGIKYVLLKGMALEHTIYGSCGLRQMTDIDILTKREDALKAWTVLQLNGFTSDILKSSLHRKIILKIGKHLPTLRKDGFAIEVHHRLFHDPAKNGILDKEIDEAKEILIESRPAYILNDEIHFNYLVEHNIDHMSAAGSQLRLFLDLELIRKGSAPDITSLFLSRPDKFKIQHGKRNIYKEQVLSLNKLERIKYCAGDIFPSLKWMKQRFNCNTYKAILIYPLRLGKLRKLI